MFPADLLERLIRDSELEPRIDLDHFAEVVAPYGLAAPQVDALIEALEKQGRAVETERHSRPTDELARVLLAARAFVAAHGHRPSPEQLARYASLEIDLVRRALSFGRIMGR